MSANTPSTSETADARGLIAAHTLVVAATLASFARAVPYPLQLHWDDARFIATNALVHSISVENLLAIVSRPHFEAYHPLHLLSYWLDVPLFGASGPALHLTSLLLYALAASAVLLLMRRLGLPPRAAVLGTLVCALHPVQVEAVSWASGRKDVLALGLAALAWSMHLRASRALDRHAMAARALYLLAALSKSTALPLPLLMALGDLLLGRRKASRALLWQLPALLMGAVLAGLVIVIWKQSTMIRESSPDLVARTVGTLGHHVWTVVWPSALSPMYSTVLPEHAPASAWLCVLIAVAIAIAAARRQQALVLLGLCSFGLLLAPALNLVPMYFPFQDRYASLPMLGAGIAAGAMFAPELDRRAARVLGTLTILALAARTVQYQGNWQSELRLWGHAASTQPDAYYAFIKLGETRRDAGELEGALRAYAAAITLAPERKLAYTGRVWVLALQDERARARAGAARHASLARLYAEQYYQALDDATRLRELAARMLATGYRRALVPALERSLLLAPAPDRALEQTARSELAHGRSDLARVYLRAMENNPSDPELRRLRELAAP